jgi:uncharacterized protein (DUF362 family)
MAKLSRREFLRTVAAGMGAIALDQFLSGCGAKNEETLIPASNTSRPAVRTQTIPPASSPTSTEPAPTKAGQTEPTSQATSTPTPKSAAGTPDLVVARGGEPEEMLRRAMAAIGGIEAFIPQGSNVIVKPNICVAYHTYEYAATTNPWLVGAMVKMCLEAGAASVRVMDYPFGGTAKEAYAISGIEEQVKAAGGEMAFMPGFKYKKVTIPNALSLKETEIFDDFLTTDVIINMPIAKTHSLAGLTLGMKNMMGVIRNRSAIHQKMGPRLTDLNGYLRPALTMVDAVRVLTANGPTGGNLDDVKQMDTIILSRDVVAADSYAASTLFGMKPESLSYIKSGAEAGLGRSDLQSLRIEELSL